MPSYSKFLDIQLIALLKEGNEVAYTEIYERYNALLYIYAYKRLNDREEAKDVIHELFLHLWERRDSIELTSGLAAYLYTSVRNKILDLIKHKKVSERYIESFQNYIDASQYSTDSLLHYKEVSALIDKEIEALPYKMQQVFKLSRIDNYTRKEIATELNLSEETVKSHMHHALKILRIKLGSLFFIIFL